MFDVFLYIGMLTASEGLDQGQAVSQYSSDLTLRVLIGVKSRKSKTLSRKLRSTCEKKGRGVLTQTRNRPSNSRFSLALTTQKTKHCKIS